MGVSRILLVEDNAVFRRAARTVLESRGHEVIEAADGGAALALVARESPSLLLLDSTLSDFPPAELVRRLRQLPSGGAVPVVGLLGLFARPEESGLAAAGFDDFLVKPLDAVALLECVETHLGWSAGERGRPGKGKRAIVVDDDPDHLAAARIRLALAGFEVQVAADGQEALERARAWRPDVIASDMLMPRLDGLGLCVAVRGDPALASVPVVLFSGNYLEKADRKLAEDAGCTAFVARTGELKELVDRVLECAGAPPLPSAPPTPAEVETERKSRALRQLERQAGLNVSLSRRGRLLQAQLGILAGVSEALAESGDLEDALRHAFVAGFDAWALCPAALYTRNADGRPVFQARSGYGPDAEPALEGFFGRKEFAARALESRETVALHPTGDRRAPEDDFLESAGARSAILVPLVVGGESVGVLLLASPRDELDEPEVRAFATTVAGQLAQAIALARAVATLRGSEERYRCLVENATDALFLLDSHGEILEANPRAEELLGRPADALRHHRFRDFAAPDAPDTGWDALARPTPEGAPRIESVHLARADGTTIPAEVSASSVRVGKADLVLIVARDVSRRRALERRLFMAKKMEAVGQLAGGIAHDFNNLLMVINGYAEILIGRTPEGQPGRHELEEILKGGQRAATLTSQLLGFSRRQVVRPRVVDLPAALVELEEEIVRVAGPGVEVSFDHAPGVSPVKIDPAQLEQVLLHLVQNSREAMEEKGGRIAIETADALLDEFFVKENEGARAGAHVVLSVRDDGRGMDEEILSRVFEPFFTTKEPGKGPGLGLATVYGIVKQNDGYVKVESRIGEGTRVRVYLPKVGPVPATPPRIREPGAEGAKEAGALVLVAEDEWAVRTLVQQILRGAGYTVLEASNGAEALELAKKCRDRIDLLLTDVVMPGIGGKELAERLAEARPGLRTIFMSGYSYDAVVAESGEGAEAEFLAKPFSPDALLEKVEGLLRARKRS